MCWGGLPCIALRGALTIYEWAMRRHSPISALAFLGELAMRLVTGRTSLVALLGREEQDSLQQPCLPALDWPIVMAGGLDSPCYASVAPLLPPLLLVSGAATLMLPP